MNKEEIEKYELFKNKYLQQPISLLTKHNLELLEEHCKKQLYHETGQRIREHETVLELIYRYKQLESKVKEVEQLRKRPNFYYDNNRNTYVWCCRCSDSDMSLHMFLENGEIQQYASEHYDKWCENVKEVRQIDVCEFMHNFVKPFIKEKNNLKAKVKEHVEEKETILADMAKLARYCADMQEEKQELIKMLEEDIKAVNCGEILSIRSVLKDCLEKLKGEND